MSFPVMTHGISGGYTLVAGSSRLVKVYRSRRPDDPRLLERLVALAEKRRRFGHRRLLIFLRREGFVVNHKRLFRIYREEWFMVRKRGGRKRALGTRTPMPGAALPNDRWSLDNRHAISIGVPM